MRLSRSLPIILLLLFFTCQSAQAQIGDILWKGFSVTCINEEDNTEIMNATVSCYGIRLVRKIVQNMLEETRKNKSLEILDGVTLVEKEDAKIGTRNGRVLKGSGPSGSIANFLENRELRISLRSFLPSNFDAIVRESSSSANKETGRGDKGGKKGGGGQDIIIIILLMGKMMAMMGFGGLGMMAMKSVIVSSVALMLSMVVAAKKISSKDEGGHHIVYTQDHHRRRRDLKSMNNNIENHPYRGYALLTAQS